MLCAFTDGVLLFLGLGSSAVDNSTAPGEEEVVVTHSPANNRVLHSVSHFPLVYFLIGCEIVEDMGIIVWWWCNKRRERENNGLSTIPPPHNGNVGIRKLVVSCLCH